MIITNVKKLKNHVELYFGDTIHPISYKVWANNYLRRDMEISEEKLEEFLKSSEIDFEIIKAVKLCKSYYSYYGMKRLLETKKYIYVEQVLSYLEANNYVNDSLFAEHFVYVEKNTKGRIYIINALKEMNISDDIIDIALRNYSINEENNLLEKLVIKELSLYRKGSKKSFLYNIINKIISKGFCYENVKIVVEENIEILDNIDEGHSLKNDYLLVKKKWARKYDGYELDQKIMTSLLTKGYSKEKIMKIRGDLHGSKESK